MLDSSVSTRRRHTLKIPVLLPPLGGAAAAEAILIDYGFEVISSSSKKSRLILRYSRPFFYPASPPRLLVSFRCREVCRVFFEGSF